MPQARTQRINPHEAKARLAKVCTIVANALAHAPKGATPAQIADVLEAMPMTLRQRFAQGCGVRAPSALTWMSAVETVRAVGA